MLELIDLFIFLYNEMLSVLQFAMTILGLGIYCAFDILFKATLSVPTTAKVC